MKDLSIGMRVTTTPAPIPGLTCRWAGIDGEIVGFPGPGNVRVAFDQGGEVTCGPDDVTPIAVRLGTLRMGLAAGIDQATRRLLGITIATAPPAGGTLDVVHKGRTVTIQVGADESVDQVAERLAAALEVST